MKKILFTIIVLVFTLPLFAQNYSVTFAYEETSGNRIGRMITLGKEEGKGENKGGKHISSPQQEILTSAFDKSIVKVYPNPNEGRFRVELLEVEETAEVFMEVTNLKGQSLIQKKANNRNEDFDISDQDQGVYILTITIDDRKQTWKIVKK